MKGLIRRILLAAIAVVAALAALCGSAQGVTVAVTGPEEMVFDWSAQKCAADADVADGPAQAIRDVTGRIELYVPNGFGHRFIGPDFNNLTRDCTNRAAAIFDPNPAHYNYAHALWSIYTENGQDVYGLIHNEWHGWEIPGACPAGIGKRRCGSGGITYAVSHDRGDSFAQPAPPDNLVATVGPRPDIDNPRTGLFTPTTPIKRGGYYYSLVLIGGLRDQDSGVCAMRTPNIADPTGWRGWDGTSFSVRFRNNYYENVSPQRTHTCEPVSNENILQMMRSVTWNSYLGKYVLTGSSIKFDPAQSQNVYGFYYSLSDDLVHWSDRELLLEVPSLLSHQCGGPDPSSYPSLLDHGSSDRNYRFTDDTMYLYFVRFHYNEACQLQLDRDVMRVPIQFSQ